LISTAIPTTFLPAYTLVVFLAFTVTSGLVLFVTLTFIRNLQTSLSEVAAFVEEMKTYLLLASTTTYYGLLRPWAKTLTGD
jgi:hypothetical protein